MLRLAFDFIITWRETRTRPNAYILRVPALVSAAIYNLFHALVANNSTHYLF